MSIFKQKAKKKKRNQEIAQMKNAEKIHFIDILKKWYLLILYLAAPGTCACGDCSVVQMKFTHGLGQRSIQQRFLEMQLKDACHFFF